MADTPRPSSHRRGAASTASTGRSALLAHWLARQVDEDALWSRLAPGPAVHDVARRLSAMPRAFVDDGVDLVALAGDALDGVVGNPLASRRPAALDLLRTVTEIEEDGSDAVHRGAAVALWLFASESELGPAEPPFAPLWSAQAVAGLAWRLAPVVDPAVWVSDAERRDEAARSFLLWSGQLPAGEDVATARGVFDARDTLRRDETLSGALQEHKHRLEIARRLQEARAREAAARPGHE